MFYFNFVENVTLTNYFTKSKILWKARKLKRTNLSPHPLVFIQKSEKYNLLIKWTAAVSDGLYKVKNKKLFFFGHFF